MPGSDFLFDQGKPVVVGSHGNNDLVYAKQEEVNDNGGSALAFEKGVGLGGELIIDDFERGNLNPYSAGTTGNIQISTSVVDSGTYSLRKLDDSSLTGTHVWAPDKTDFPNVPAPGDTFEMKIYPTAGVEDINNSKFGFLYGVDPSISLTQDDGSTLVRSYSFEVRPGKPDITSRLYLAPDGTDSKELGTFSIDNWDYSDEYITQEVAWQEDGTQTTTLFDAQGDLIVQGTVANDVITAEGSIGYFLQEGEFFADNYKITGSA